MGTRLSRFVFVWELSGILGNPRHDPDLAEVRPRPWLGAEYPEIASINSINIKTGWF